MDRTYASPRSAPSFRALSRSSAGKRNVATSRSVVGVLGMVPRTSGGASRAGRAPALPLAAWAGERAGRAAPAPYAQASNSEGRLRDDSRSALRTRRGTAGEARV